MMRSFLLAALIGALAVPASAAKISLNFIGQQSFPTGTQAIGTTLGGLSGIDYDAASGRYVAISDDRSQLGAARFYTLDLALSSASFDGVSFTAVETMKQPGGGGYPILSIDPEAIRFSGAGGFFYTSEGDANAGQSPFVREMAADGSFIRDFSVTGSYTPVAGTNGIRNNLAFESLVLSNDGTQLLTATENALVQDGPAATTDTSSPARILAFDIASGAAVAEYVYEVDPVAIAPSPMGAFATNGLVELLGLGGSEYLAVERSFSVGAPGTGNTIRLYHVDLAGSTNVLGVPALAGQTYAAATKTLLLDLDALGIPLDNIEGVTFGELLENGNRSLILVSDNNFSQTQFTQFLAFEVETVPEPGTWAMMIAGFGLVGGAMRRRTLRRLTAWYRPSRNTMAQIGAGGL